MENVGFTSSSMLDPSRDALMDIDFMDQLYFGGGCWVDSSDQYNSFQPGLTSFGLLNSSLNYLPPLDYNTSHLTIDPNHNSYSVESKKPNLPGTQQEFSIQGQLESFLIEGNELSRTWWTSPTPKVDSCLSPHIGRRLMLAIKLLNDSTKDRNILIQIWVPVRREGKIVLTTIDQLFSVDPNCKSLEYYRNVSENYQFLAEEDSKESVGLLVRVFLGKVPEWTPDVTLFKTKEYPRKDYAKQYNVQGSIALPVFERGSGTCLGVVEIVTTTQKLNYRPELESVCKALEAVDLRSSEVINHNKIKACNYELYKGAYPEIIEVLTSICRTHRLPLAQTWAPCIQHGKSGGCHSSNNYANCVSTIDSAFYATNAQILGFHEACLEHNLCRGKGVVGRASMTNEPCFAADITAHTKTEYPLSHLARMFGLCAAVAVRLRCVHTGLAEFIFEFFLPTECRSIEEQNLMLRSMSSALQQAGRSLRTLTGTELREDVLLPVKEKVVLTSNQMPIKEETVETKRSTQNDLLRESPSWATFFMESQQKGEPKQEFKVLTHWDPEKESFHCRDFGALEQKCGAKGIVDGGGDSSSYLSGHRTSGGRKAGEIRRTKTEKMISLEVLRQYFAGSLKDAAKSIGVCPTTLKRICRQHGITRWPSRKIKKVGHSLRKLQLVINSVQGAEGSLQIGNFYSNYPELSSPNNSGPSYFSSLQPEHSIQQEGPPLSSPGPASSKSTSSCCSQSSSGCCCSTEVNRKPPSMVQSLPNGNALLAEDSGGALKRTHSNVELHILKHEEINLLRKSNSHKSLGRHHHSHEILPHLHKHNTGFRVKATFGEEKVRFSLQHNWVFNDLHQEIATRFGMMDDISRIDLKYLDDDSEWVLLTCNADLEECIDIYKSCRRHTIKLSVHLATSHPYLGNPYGSTGLC